MLQMLRAAEQHLLNISCCQPGQDKINGRAQARVYHAGGAAHIESEPQELLRIMYVDVGCAGVAIPMRTVIPFHMCMY